MTTILTIHPTNPQPRLIQRAVNLVASDGVIAFPTDSGFALGCALGNKDAVARIRHLRRLDKQHNFTLLCNDLSQLASYARVDNPTYRLLKSYTPGPYTFILSATKEVPRRLVHPKRKTIGIRVPEHLVTQALLESLAAPIMSVSLIIPHLSQQLRDFEDICEQLNGKVDLLIDNGLTNLEPTSVIDLTKTPPQVLRQGQGDVSAWL